MEIRFDWVVSARGSLPGFLKVLEYSTADHTVQIMHLRHCSLLAADLQKAFEIVVPVVLILTNSISHKFLVHSRPVVSSS